VLFISVFTEPVAFGLIKPPGDFNADIVCGEGQSLGMPPGYGGPLLGIFTSKNQFVRNMPGRIVGEAVDRNGARSFVLTLAAREQHIRREKSTSNICTNQGLCALTAAVYLSWLGKKGIEEMALLNYRKAGYAKHQLKKINGINLKFSQPNFNEFVIEIDMETEGVVMKLAEKGILAGIPLKKLYKNLDRCILISVTEMNTKDEIDNLCNSLQNILEKR
jgi:glycine dehydrogenase subunit 1